MTPTITVALMNDFDIVVNGLAQMLSPFDDIVVVETSVQNSDLDRPVQIALYDTYGRSSVPWGELGVTGERRAEHVVVFTFTFAPHIVSEAIAQGVSGFLWKGRSAEQLSASLRRIAAGETVVDEVSDPNDTQANSQRWPFDEIGLTARESEVLTLIAKGFTNPAIAEALFISRETVKSHVKQVLRKLGASSRSEAAIAAINDPSFTHQPGSS